MGAAGCPVDVHVACGGLIVGTDGCCLTNDDSKGDYFVAAGEIVEEFLDFRIVCFVRLS